MDDVKLQSRLSEARHAVRRVLARRKLHLSGSDQSRIDACSNLETLERWHDNAIDASSASIALE